MAVVDFEKGVGRFEIRMRGWLRWECDCNMLCDVERGRLNSVGSYPVVLSLILLSL